MASKDKLQGLAVALVASLALSMAVPAQGAVLGAAGGLRLAPAQMEPMTVGYWYRGRWHGGCWNCGGNGAAVGAGIALGILGAAAIAGAAAAPPPVVYEAPPPVVYEAPPPVVRVEPAPRVYLEPAPRRCWVETAPGRGYWSPC